MTGKVLFIMGLHSHQPVGNFDFIVEDATRECYHPFLETLERYPQIRTSLHYSGVLLEWLRRNRPETFDLLGRLVESGQVEMMGGAFYEPVLVMIPDRDKSGQIRKQSEYIEEHFGVKPEGLWLAERVWEQCLVKPIADSGLSYVALDDSHFKFAGLGREDLSGYYVTEDRGRMLNVFPMDELLRYYIPFQDPEKTIEYLGTFARGDGPALVTYADDGEKFGSWPGTHKHVYADGWLERFFKLLTDNADWIEFVTFSEAQARVRPSGRVFLPDASYREMMKWVLPVDTQHEYEDLVADLKAKGGWERAKFFVKGSFWRSFRAKYPEANEMYSKMMLVSEKVAQLARTGGRYEEARDELYQGQCNCSYWHGVFGGLYLPHLRSAVYEHLIAAENIADEELKGKRNWCDSQVIDYNFDRRPEVILSSPHLSLYVVPHRGGHLAELDDRDRETNLLGVMTRREEAYHRTVLRKHREGNQEGGDVASIHDSIVFKTEGLGKMLQYDAYKREGFIDHVLDGNVTPEEFAAGNFVELGDFVEGEYEFEVSKHRKTQRLILTRDGGIQAGEERVPLGIRKEITLGAKDAAFAVEYELMGPTDRAVSFVFGVETCYSQLQTPNSNVKSRKSMDFQVSGLEFRVTFSEPADVWTFPLETVSQSEGGVEAVHQGTVVLAHWKVELKPKGSWAVRIEQAHTDV